MFPVAVLSQATLWVYQFLCPPTHPAQRNIFQDGEYKQCFHTFTFYASWRRLAEAEELETQGSIHIQKKKNELSEQLPFCYHAIRMYAFLI
jgi:hypothetical protein